MGVLKNVFLTYIMVVETEAWTRIFAAWTHANTNKVTPVSSTEVAPSGSVIELTMHRTTMSSAATTNSKDCFSNTTTAYGGKQNITSSNHTCLRWDSSLIPLEDRLQDADFPVDGSVQHANNYCRDPNESGDLWCYVTNPEVRTDKCVIPKCNTTEEKQPESTILASIEDDAWWCRYPTKDCIEDEQLVCYDKVYTMTIKEDCIMHLCCYKRGCIDKPSPEYAGRWSHSAYYEECLRWDSITNLPFSGQSFPEGSIADANNYCRDPDHMGLPYCFVNENTRYYCGIPTCSELASRHKYSHDCYKPTSRDSVDIGQDVTENDLCLLDRDRTVIDSDELREKYPGCKGCSCCQIQKCHMDASESYKGTWSRTASGRECKSWTVTEYASYPDFFFSYGNTVSNSENFCRDFFGIGYTFCLTKDLNMGYEKCNLKIECPSDSSKTTLKRNPGWFTFFFSGTPTSKVTQETTYQKETTTMGGYITFDISTQTFIPSTTRSTEGFTNNVHVDRFTQKLSAALVGQTSVVFESKTPSVKQTSVVYESKTPSVEQTSVVYESKTPSIEQTSVVYESKTPSVDQTSVVYESKTPSVEQTSVVYESKTPSVEQTSVVYESKTPSVEQTSIVYESKTPSVEQTSIVYESKTPSVEQTSIVYESKTPSVEQTSIVYESKTPSVEQTSVVYESKTPSVEQTSVVYESKTPSVEQTSVVYESKTPSVDQTSVVYESKMPSVDQTSVVYESKTPSVDQTSVVYESKMPSVDQTSVVYESKTPSVDQTSVVYESKMPSVDQTSVVYESKTPSVEQTSEVYESKTPSVDQTSVVYESKTPSVERTSVVYESKTPSVERTSVVYESKTPSVEQTSVVYESKTPSVEHILEVYESETRLVDQTSVVYESKTPSVERTSVVYESKAPSVEHILEVYESETRLVDQTSVVYESKTHSVDKTLEAYESTTPSVDQTAEVNESKTSALSQTTENTSAPYERKSFSTDKNKHLTTHVHTWESAVEQNETEWQPSKAHGKQTTLSALFLIVSLHLF